jgi:hypothetical protein
MTGTHNMPSSVRVGFKTYSIAPWASLEASASSCIGECDRLNLEIRVREDLPLQQAQNTLLHEILHACWDMHNLSSLEANEEHIICALTNSFQQVAQDNPHVIDWLFGTTPSLDDVIDQMYAEEGA